MDFLTSAWTRRTSGTVQMHLNQPHPRPMTGYQCTWWKSRQNFPLDVTQLVFSMGSIHTTSTLQFLGEQVDREEARLGPAR